MSNILFRKKLKINRLSILFTSALLAYPLCETYADGNNSLNAYKSPGQMFFSFNDSFISQNEKGIINATPIDAGDEPTSSQTTITPTSTPPISALDVPFTQISDSSDSVNKDLSDSQRSIYINFNNIGMIEYIRFLSRTLNKNFTFDENDLQFNVTIISDEPMTFDNIMTALLQELRIHGLSLLEQGNNLIIHKNRQVNAISQVVADDTTNPGPLNEIVTQVFRLNTADPEKVAAVIRPLTSEFALIEVLPGTNHLIITDLSANVSQIAKLIKSIDSPNSGLVIGQYVVRTTSPADLIEISQQIIGPISQDQPLKMVPWLPSNSIFIISTPYIVERTLSILQHIDQNFKSTTIFDLQQLKFQAQTKALPTPRLTINGESFEPSQEELEFYAAAPATKFKRAPHEPSEWEKNQEGRWKLNFPEELENRPPEGQWLINKLGNWTFHPGPPEEGAGGLPEGQLVPKGSWVLEPSGGWSYVLQEGESIQVKRLSRAPQPSTEIPLGVKPKSRFTVYKLQYRKGDIIQRSLQSIANGLLGGRDVDYDLVDTLTSVQWLDSSNTIIFTGYEENLTKMRELMHLIDVPLRQVFIEVLVLETSLEDALEYSVTWGTRFAGQNWAGGEGFNQSGGTNLPSPLNNTLNLGLKNGPLSLSGASVANNLFGTQGLNLGVVGQKIINTALGIEFSSIGALVQAIRLKNNTNVILNPKIITEDGVPAEIFVGENIPFKTQSISNDIGNNITTNFQFRDVGTRFRVTPIIGNTDIITLEIAQEISAILPTASGGGNINNQAQGPSTTKSTTTTRVHLPSGYFLIISGMMRDECDQATIQVPCLGAIPIIGAAFKDKSYTKSKRNQMIFIRPIIVETEEELQSLTKHEQDIWEFKKQWPMKQDWVYETEEAFDFLNLRRNPIVETDPFRDETIEY